MTIKLKFKLRDIQVIENDNDYSLKLTIDDNYLVSLRNRDTISGDGIFKKSGEEGTEKKLRDINFIEIQNLNKLEALLSAFSIALRREIIRDSADGYETNQWIIYLNDIIAGNGGDTVKLIGINNDTIHFNSVDFGGSPLFSKLEIGASKTDQPWIIKEKFQTRIFKQIRWNYYF